MSIDVENTRTRVRGMTFNYWAGRGVLACPDPEDTTKWMVFNPATRALTSMVVDELEFTEVTDVDELITGLVTSWKVCEDLRQAAEQTVAAKVQLVDDIREYAIRAHLDGSICKDGLNTALAHFGVEPYEPRFKVPVTITATFEITADDEDSAERRVRYLIDGVGYSGDNSDDEVEVSLNSVDVEIVEAL